MTRWRTMSPLTIELLTAACDGSANTEQIAQLDRLLAEDAELQQAFLDLCQLESDLQLRERASAAFATGLGEIDSLIRQTEPAHRIPQDSKLVDLPHNSRWRRIIGSLNNSLTAALSIATLTITIILLLLSIWVVPEWRPNEPPTVVESANFVARLSLTQSAAWDSETQEDLSEGRDLFVGQRLGLENGLALLRFDNGVEVRVRGPAEFEIDSANALHLHNGAITAQVPPQAVGFAVSSKAAQLVDLGTEFGVTATPIGATDVYVFSGQVEVAPLIGAHARERLVLKSGQALRIEQDGSWDRSTASSGELTFAPLREAFAPPNELESLPAWQSLSVWLSAGSGIETDDQLRVRKWALKHDARPTSPTAVPVGRAPRFVPSLFAGKPSVEFDNTTGLLRYDSLTLEQGVALAAVVSPRQTENHGRQMILRLEGGGVFGLDFNDHRHIVGRFFTKLPGNAAMQNVAVTTSRPLPCEPMLVIYNYDPRQGNAALHVNGQHQATAEAPVAASGEYSLTLGGHPHEGFPFSGRIAEVLVYTRALQQDEIDQLSLRMSFKYKLPRTTAATD